MIRHVILSNGICQGQCLLALSFVSWAWVSCTSRNDFGRYSYDLSWIWLAGRGVFLLVCLYWVKKSIGYFSKSFKCLAFHLQISIWYLPSIKMDYQFSSACYSILYYFAHINLIYFNSVERERKQISNSLIG